MIEESSGTANCSNRELRTRTFDRCNVQPGFFYQKIWRYLFGASFWTPCFSYWYLKYQYNCNLNSISSIKIQNIIHTSLRLYYIIYRYCCWVVSLLAWESKCLEFEILEGHILSFLFWYNIISEKFIYDILMYYQVSTTLFVFGHILKSHTYEASKN